MIGSAFFFHLISAITIVVLVYIVVRVKSRLLLMQSFFQLLKSSEGNFKRRIFVNSRSAFLESFCKVFSIEFFAKNIASDLKKLSIENLLKLHLECQILKINCDADTLIILLCQLPENFSYLRQQLLTDLCIKEDGLNIVIAS